MNLTPKKSGYGVILDKLGQKEFDTLTCKHCNRAYVISSSNRAVSSDPGGLCRVCMGHVCSSCLDGLVKTGCVPFEKKLDLYERRQDLFVKMGLEL